MGSRNKIPGDLKSPRLTEICPDIYLIYVYSVKIKIFKFFLGDVYDLIVKLKFKIPSAVMYKFQCWQFSCDKKTLSHLLCILKHTFLLFAFIYSFPQKPIERSGSAQYGIAAIPGSNTSGSESGGYVYLQQHYVPSTTSTNSANSIAYQMDNQPSMVFQQQPQQYASCHQQQQQHQLPMNLHTGNDELMPFCFVVLILSLYIPLRWHTLCPSY